MTRGRKPIAPLSRIEPVGAQPTDPWFARLAFLVLQHRGPWWLTLWLALIIGGLVGLGMVAGPWPPGVITAVGALAAGGTASARHLRAKRSTDENPTAPDRPPSDEA